MKNEMKNKSQDSSKTLQEYLEQKEVARQEKVRARQVKSSHKSEEKQERIKQKNKYKLEKLKAKEEHAKEKASIDKKHHFRWYNFFTKWFLLGVILVLVSICISLHTNTLSEGTVRILLTIVSGVLSSVGIALFVGCVFDFSKNSEAFMSFISQLLTDIIVSKTFLASLVADDKKEALKLILQPSNKQIEQYSNINEFFKKKINDYMNMFDTNFKTNLILNIEAKKDKNGRVYCESILTYTVYKVRDEFEPIMVAFEKEGSRSIEVKIIHSTGEKEIKESDCEELTEVFGGVEQKVYRFVIPEELRACDHLTIKRKMYEPGADHWINYCWGALTPSEGITCHVKCFDDLSIKEHMIFDNRAYYHTEISEDRKTMCITSAQWLEANTGFYITISDTSIQNTK